MPAYTENPNDNFTDVARLSGNHILGAGNSSVPGGLLENSVINLSAFNAFGDLVWRAEDHVLNNGSGLAVGAIFTIHNGTQEYEITALDNHGAWTHTSGSDPSGAVYTCKATITPGVVAADVDALSDDKNSGVLVTRKFQGTHKSYADHLRLRRQGII